MFKSKRKKILCYFNAVWNCGIVTSGGEQMFIQILQRTRLNLDTIWCVTSKSGSEFINREVPKVEFLTSPSFFDSFGMMGSYCLRTFFALKFLFVKPDVIYSSSDFFPDVVPAFVLKLFKPKTRWVQCVFHIYPDWRVRPGSKVKNIVGQYLQKFSLLLARRADVILNINNGVKDYLIHNGFNPNQIVVIPPGIDPGFLDNIDPLPQNQGYDGIFLGRLNVNKGALDLIDIWAHVVKLKPKSRLGIIGGGDEAILSKIKSKIANYGIESQIDLLGFLNNDQAFPLIKASKVFLFPSREEGFGIAIVEAMHCGLPVIGWNLPVFTEHFDKAIDLIELENHQLFAKKVIFYLDNPDNISKKILDGKTCAKKFTWDKTAKSFLECIS